MTNTFSEELMMMTQLCSFRHNDKQVNDLPTT